MEKAAFAMRTDTYNIHDTQLRKVRYAFFNISALGLSRLYCMYKLDCGWEDGLELSVSGGRRINSGKISLTD